MPGKPAHEPTEQIRKQVEAMSSYGIPQEDIAKVIEVDPKTLRKYYRYELDCAEVKANAMVAGKLYKNCMDGKESSIFFWLKTRAGFKEKSTVEHEGDLNININKRVFSARDTD